MRNPEHRYRWLPYTLEKKMSIVVPVMIQNCHSTHLLWYNTGPRWKENRSCLIGNFVSVALPGDELPIWSFKGTNAAYHGGMFVTGIEGPFGPK